MCGVDLSCVQKIPACNNQSKVDGQIHIDVHEDEKPVGNEGNKLAAVTKPVPIDNESTSNLKQVTVDDGSDGNEMA